MKFLSRSLCMHVYQIYLLVLFLWLNPGWWKSHSKSHNYYTFSKNVCLCFLTGKMGILSINKTRIHYCKWVYKIHKSELQWMCLTILGLNITFQLKGTNHREKLKRSSKLSTKTLLFYEQEHFTWHWGVLQKGEDMVLI